MIIIIDSATISIPNFANSEAEAEMLIDRVIHYAEMASHDLPLKLGVWDDLEERLGINCATYQSVKDYLEIMGLEYLYDAKDVFKQVMAIQNRSERVSELGIPVAISYEAVDIDPPIPPILSPTDLIRETVRGLITTSVARERGFNVALSSSMPDGGPELCRLSATNVTVMENSVLSLRAVHEGVAGRISEMRDLATMQSALDIWNTAANCEDIYFSIALGAAAKLLMAGRCPSGIKHFTIGSDFYGSLAANQSINSSTYSNEVAATCFELAAGLFSGTMKPFGKKAQVVRSRDGAKGFRCHVTKSGVAIRLMFWETGPILEFSNIGSKREVEIADGDKDNLTKYDLDFIKNALVQ